jgi:hypothetical protein
MACSAAWAWHESLSANAYSLEGINSLMSLFPEPASTAFPIAQSILRHSNVGVTLGYYIKPQSEDVIAAMGRFEAEMAAHDLRDSNGTVNRHSGAMPKSVN